MLMPEEVIIRVHQMAQGFQNNEDTLEDVSDNINSLEDQE